MGKFQQLFSAAALASTVMLAEPAQAYDLRPIVLQLSPTGPGTTQSVIITNSHDEPIAIELRAFRREQKPDGTEDRVPEDEDIIISPPQLVIAPGASQSVRVRWVGNPAPDHELSYRLVSEQLPIKLASEKRGDFSANVSVNYRYEAALYVTPDNAAPSAQIVRAEPVTDQNGMPMLELEIANSGTRRATLEEPRLKLTSASGQEVTLEGDAVKPLAQMVTLVGAHRTVRVAWPENFAVGPVKAELQTRYLVLK